MEEKLSIQEMINKALEKKNERPRSGKFSPSSLGRCFRAQIWNRRNEPVSNPPDERTQRVFKAGNLFHSFVQDLFIAHYPEAQKEVLVENEDFKGYADLVVNGEVIDIKSQHSNAFHYRRNLAWNELEKKLFCNILQVVFYAVELRKDKVRLVFVSKDDLCIQEYPLNVNNYKMKLGEEIATLRDFWSYETLPPAIPRAYPDKNGNLAECGYCSWKNHCEEIEKEVVKRSE